MKNNFDKVAMTTALLICHLMAFSQEKPDRKAWELGIGGSAQNLTRTTVSDFRQTSGGGYVFNLEEKMLFGGINSYVAKEMNRWLYVDVQGTCGLARFYDSGLLKQGYSIMAGPGIQFRPFVRSEWVQPYLRLGVNFFRKTFPVTYFGKFEGDVTNESIWKAEDAWNKGDTFDSDSYVPLSASVGLVGWLSDRFGVRIQGDYLRSLDKKGANSALATAGVVFRLGGEEKRKNRIVRMPPEIIEKIVEKEVVREIPVEVEKEIIREVYSERTLAEMMDNVNFEFDTAVLTCESFPVLDEIAGILHQFQDMNFLIAGYTDAKGSAGYNERLSTERAKAVYDALLERGVSKSRLVYRGFGKRMALVPATASDDERRGDRKVVIERVSLSSLWKYLNR